MAVTLRPHDKLRTPKPVNKPPGIRLPWPLNLYQTAVGKKWVMGLTGLGLIGFVVAHMIGNLHLYEGPVEVHEYAEALRDLGGDLIPRTYALWLMRVGLLVMFALHIHSAVALSRINLASNSRYESNRDYAAANFASRTTRWTGVIIALFLFYHLADLTWGWFDDDWVRGDPYGNVDRSLSRVPVAILYIVANVALAVHLFHGIFSMFTSLGINSPKLNPMRRPIAGVIAGLILVGNLSIPILTQAGVIEEERPLIEEIELQEALEASE
jgi:succinate dehydrogenase / fumarate reductase cytochrome b subunit